MRNRFSSASSLGLGDASSLSPAAFTDRTITGRVLLDGGSFDRCRFRRATLIYCGGAPPKIEGCSFEGVTFEFDGAAARTLALLKAMAAPSSGLRDVFKASFPAMFGH
jgi:hypothetical protein